MKKLAIVPSSYSETFTKIKQKIARERVRTVLAANAAMVLLYWEIGATILGDQKREGWGTLVVDRLARDLQNAFPDMKGFSSRNLKYMRAFAAAWPDRSIVQEALALIPWYHNIALLEKLNEPAERLWYARQARLEGWSHNVLAIQIERGLHNRRGRTSNNFAHAVLPAESDLVTQAFKDPYVFDFLGTAGRRRETEIEDTLIDHVQKVLLELGTGFSFVGRQVHVEVGGDDFYIDLLFYHLHLRRYVIVELKAVPFKPEFVGKLNVYLAAIDDKMKRGDDKPTIGLLLVKQKNRVLVDYALRGFSKPIGVAEWETKITKALPKELKSSLPTIEQLEEELG